MMPLPCLQRTSRPLKQGTVGPIHLRDKIQRNQFVAGPKFLLPCL